MAKANQKRTSEKLREEFNSIEYWASNARRSVYRNTRKRRYSERLLADNEFMDKEEAERIAKGWMEATRKFSTAIGAALADLRDFYAAEAGPHFIRND